SWRLACASWFNPRMSRLLAVVVCAALASTSSSAGQNVPPPVTVETLVDLAGTYVTRFMIGFSNVVAEERYLQQASGRQTYVGTGGRSGVLLGSGEQRRELVSDFLLVRLEDPATWVPSRDVSEVDGKPVR